MKRIIFAAAAIFLFLPLLHAVSLGISPARIHMASKQGELVCSNFSISGEPESVFYGKLRWSRSYSEDISNYELNSSYFGINATLDKSAGPGTHRLCIVADKPGIYHGALMYKLEGSHYGVASWVEFDVSGTDSILAKAIHLSGNLVKTVEIQNWRVFFAAGIVSLLIVVFLAVRSLRKRFKNQGRELL